ncbi:tensin-1-like [Sycon ciliatum]|uniref:tensin-1-like n=1 Tax=Sycon ciliatum TaxID=27933 RepID=UPI0031F6BD47
MKQGKHNRAKERLQQRAAANRAGRIPAASIGDGSSSRDVLSGGAFKPVRSLSGVFTPVQRAAYYVGSFPAAVPKGEDISKVVERKLRALTIKKDAPGVPVKVVVLKDGIKIFRVDGETLFMAHSLSRISLSMGFRHMQCFAFVARNPTARGGETLCHVVYCTQEETPDELSNLVSEAFQLAYVEMLSSKSHLAHAPKLIKSPSGDLQDIAKQGSSGKPASRPPSLPESVAEVDVAEQQRLLEMFSKQHEQKKQDTLKAQAQASHSPRPQSADEQRRIREEQQEKMMKRLDLMHQREELLEQKRRQQQEQQLTQQQQPPQPQNQQQQHPQETLPAGQSLVVKRRVVRKGDSTDPAKSPQMRRRVMTSTAGAQSGASPLVAHGGKADESGAPQTTAGSQNAVPLPPRGTEQAARPARVSAAPANGGHIGSDAAHQHHSHNGMENGQLASNVLPLPPRGHSSSPESQKKAVTKALPHQRESVSGQFLPQGGFLPEDALSAVPVLPVTQQSYEDVNASEELAALVRMARETSKRDTSSQAQVTAALPPPIPKKDGYMQPKDSVVPALPRPARTEVEYDQPAVDMVGMESTAAGTADTLQGTQPAPLGVPRRVKRTLPRTAAITDEPTQPEPAPEQQLTEKQSKRASLISASESLQFLQNAAAGLDLYQTEADPSAQVSSPVANMDPLQFLQMAAEGLSAENSPCDPRAQLEYEDAVEWRRPRQVSLDDSIAQSDDEMNPSHAQWFQSGIPREVAMEILSHQPVGAFIVRDSHSRQNCFALSLRIDDGITHFLIEQVDDGTVRFTGQEQCFADLGSLISFHCHTPGPLPLPLSIVKLNPNLGLEDDSDDDDDGDGIDGLMIDDDYHNLIGGENIVLLS